MAAVVDSLPVDDFTASHQTSILDNDQTIDSSQSSGSSIHPATAAALSPTSDSTSSKPNRIGPTDSGISSLSSSSLDVSSSSTTLEKKFGFSEVIQKRLRTLKKRLTKIEKYESCDIPSLNQDQLESIRGKPVVKALVSELSEIAVSISNLESEELKAIKKQQKQNIVEKQAAVKKSVRDSTSYHNELFQFALKVVSALNTVLEQPYLLDESSIQLLHSVKVNTTPSNLDYAAPSHKDDLNKSTNFIRKIFDKNDSVVEEFDTDNLTYASLFSSLEHILFKQHSKDIQPEEPQDIAEMDKSTAQSLVEEQTHPEPNAVFDGALFMDVPTEMGVQAQTEPSSNYPEMLPNLNIGGRTNFLTGHEFIHAVQHGQVPAFVPSGDMESMSHPPPISFERDVQLSFVGPPHYETGIDDVRVMHHSAHSSQYLDVSHGVESQNNAILEFHPTATNVSADTLTTPADISDSMAHINLAHHEYHNSVDESSVNAMYDPSHSTAQNQDISDHEGHLLSSNSAADSEIDRGVRNARGGVNRNGGYRGGYRNNPRGRGGSGYRAYRGGYHNQYHSSPRYTSSSGNVGDQYSPRGRGRGRGGRGGGYRGNRNRNSIAPPESERQPQSSDE